MDYTSATGYVTDAQGRRQYQDRDLLNGIKGTSLVAADRNSVMNSLLYLIQAVQIVPNPNDDTQVWAAVEALIKAALIGVAGTLDFMPVQQGDGFDQGTDKICLGKDTTYPGLRYSYRAADGETVIGGGYLISSYGAEPGGAAGYAQIGDISADPNGRMVWRPPGLGTAYAVSALYSDVTTETSDRVAAVSALQSWVGNQYYIPSTSPNDTVDYQITQMAWQASTSMPWVYANGGAKLLATYSGLSSEISNRTAAVSNLQSQIDNCVFGNWQLSGSNVQVYGLNVSSAGVPQVYTASSVIAVATASALATETSDRVAAVAAVQNQLPDYVSGTWAMASGDTQVEGLTVSGNTKRPQVLAASTVYGLVTTGDANGTSAYASTIPSPSSPISESRTVTCNVPGVLLIMASANVSAEPQPYGCAFEVFLDGASQVKDTTLGTMSHAWATNVAAGSHTIEAIYSTAANTGNYRATSVTLTHLFIPS